MIQVLSEIAHSVEREVTEEKAAMLELCLLEELQKEQDTGGPQIWK